MSTYNDGHEVEVEFRLVIVHVVCDTADRYDTFSIATEEYEGKNTCKIDTTFIGHWSLITICEN